MIFYVIVKEVKHIGTRCVCRNCFMIKIWIVVVDVFGVEHSLATVTPVRFAAFGMTRHVGASVVGLLGLEFASWTHAMQRFVQNFYHILANLLQVRARH